MFGQQEVKCEDPHDGTIMDIHAMITGSNNE